MCVVNDRNVYFDLCLPDTYTVLNAHDNVKLSLDVCE